MDQLVNRLQKNDDLQIFPQRLKVESTSRYMQRPPQCTHRHVLRIVRSYHLQAPGKCKGTGILPQSKQAY